MECFEESSHYTVILYATDLYKLVSLNKQIIPPHISKEYQDSLTTKEFVEQMRQKDPHFHID